MERHSCRYVFVAVSLKVPEPYFHLLKFAGEYGTRKKLGTKNMQIFQTLLEKLVTSIPTKRDNLLLCGYIDILLN